MLINGELDVSLQYLIVKIMKYPYFSEGMYQYSISQLSFRLLHSFKSVIKEA